MSLRTTKCAAIGLGIGFGFGLLMDVLAFAAENNPAAMKLWNWIDAPAQWVADCWINKTQLPPRGEIAWLVVPSVATLVQWSLIGLLVGLWWGRPLDGKVESLLDSGKTSPSSPPARQAANPPVKQTSDQPLPREADSARQDQ